MSKLDFFLWLIQIVFVGLVHTSTAQVERSPWLACGAIENEQECTEESFCCFDKPTQTCFSPNLDDDLNVRLSSTNLHAMCG